MVSFQSGENQLTGFKQGITFDDTIAFYYFKLVSKRFSQGISLFVWLIKGL